MDGTPNNANLPGYGMRTGGPGAGRQPPGKGSNANPNISPLHSLITPEIVSPFACNRLPAPAPSTLSPIVNENNCAYFGLQVLDGEAHGIAKLCGVNYWIASTFNDSFTQAFPAVPTFISGFDNQEYTVGNAMGTGAGLFVALSNDLPFNPIVGGWCGGPPLFPWLMPNSGEWFNNPNPNRQIWGTPFAPGNMTESHVQIMQGSVRDTPLGWDVPRSSKVWVLIGIDGGNAKYLGAPPASVFLNVQGSLVFAAANRRFALD